MKKNYVDLTIPEFHFLIMYRDRSSVPGFQDVSAEWNEMSIKKCAETLMKKNILIQKENGDTDICSPLDLWIYAIIHSDGYFEANSLKDERLLFYFYQESIISIYIKNDCCQLIWLPFIHLAIGQLAGILKTTTYQEWIFSVVQDTQKTEDSYAPSKDESFIDVVHNATKLLVPIHGNAMKGAMRE